MRRSLQVAVGLGSLFVLPAGCGSSTQADPFATAGGSAGSATATATGTGGGTVPTSGGIAVTSGAGSAGSSASNASSSGGTDTDASCGATMQGTNAIPSDIFIMNDKSGSMQCPASDDSCDTNVPNPLVHPTRWESFSTAINTFINSPSANGVGVGIGFFALFSRGTTVDCTVGNYAKPTVAISPLPGNAMAIANAVAANMPSGGTPTTPALTGAIQYAQQYTMATPGRTASVLLVTDGVPNGCNSSGANATAAAMAGFTGTPSIKTYVVGLGNTANLDSIALAGTGNATHYFPATGDIAASLVAALGSITSMVTCNYGIPAGDDASKVNIQVALGGGATTPLTGVADAAACDAAGGGWYYDDPMAPKQIILCPQSCDPLKTTQGSSVQVLFGCPTKCPTCGIH